MTHPQSSRARHAHRGRAIGRAAHRLRATQGNDSVVLHRTDESALREIDVVDESSSQARRAAPVVSKKRFPPFSLMAAEPMGLNEPAAEPPVSTSEGAEVKLYEAPLLAAVTLRVEIATVAFVPGLVICVMKVLWQDVRPSHHHPWKQGGGVSIDARDRGCVDKEALPVVLEVVPSISIVVPLPRVLCCVVPLKQQATDTALHQGHVSARHRIPPHQRRYPY